MDDAPLFVSGRRGFLGNVLTGSLAATLPPAYARAASASPDDRAEMEHVEALFKEYEDARSELEATPAGERRWRRARQRETDALHALLCYQDKSLLAFKVRADCIQALIEQDKLSRRHFGTHGDAFELFINSVARF